MSKEDEVNLRIVAAIVAAACHVLGVDRDVWVKPSCCADAVMWFHLAAMHAAAVRLGAPMSARETLLAWPGVVNMKRTPFERELVNFYVEMGRRANAENLKG